jgi:hypothetical protein
MQPNALLLRLNFDSQKVSVTMWKLYQNPMDSDRESLLESLKCIGILACRDSHDITSEWTICQL